MSELSFLEPSGSSRVELCCPCCVKISWSSPLQNALPHSEQWIWFFLLLPFTYDASPNPEAWFLFLTTSRWFAVRLDAICAIFVIIVAFGSLILATSEYRWEELFVVWLQFIAAFTVIKLNSCHLVQCHYCLVLMNRIEAFAVCRVGCDPAAWSAQSGHLDPDEILLSSDRLRTVPV